MVNVLFVCLGNICRSPMAEAVFRKKVKEAGLEDKVKTDSAGTGDWHVGKTPHSGTRSLLQSKGIDYSNIFARQVTKEDLVNSDYVIAMDDNNVAALKDHGVEEERTHIAKLLDFIPQQEVTNVPDPYFTGNFDEVYDLVHESCERLLLYIREKEDL